MFLGGLFLLIIGLLVYLYMTDPWDIKKYFNNVPVADLLSGKAAPVSENYDHPLLTADQENTLRQIGIDPAKLPAEITPDMEKCLIEAVGADRAGEIVGGSAPSALEIFRAKACLN